MNSDNQSWLIDAIIRKTLSLIAQLATSGGQRAPLSRLADQVFLDLAAELEGQGLSQKVIADMFGLAVRSYQRKRRRLLESKTLEGRSLWASVLDLIQERPRIARWEIMQTFSRDDMVMVGSVLMDLVASSLVYQTGHGPMTQYGPTSDSIEDWTTVEAEAIAEHLVWLRIYNDGPLDREALGKALNIDAPVVDQALEGLVADDRIEQVDAVWQSRRWLIPYGSLEGWPAAVFEHYAAMVDALCAKLRSGSRSAHHDAIGGSTYTFVLDDAHPMAGEVMELMGEFRTRAHDLRVRLDAHPASENLAQSGMRVTMYLGQNVTTDA